MDALRLNPVYEPGVGKLIRAIGLTYTVQVLIPFMNRAWGNMKEGGELDMMIGLNPVYEPGVGKLAQSNSVSHGVTS